MHTELPPSGHASNPEVRYEKTDATARPLYQFLFWISAITILTAVFAGLVLRGLQSWRSQASTRAIMAEPRNSQRPPAPRLQMREPLDLAAFKKEEAEILSTYGIVDREKGAFRIPIEEAMKLTVERGLPIAGDPAATPPTKAPSPPARKPGKTARP